MTPDADWDSIRGFGKYLMKTIIHIALLGIWAVNAMAVVPMPPVVGVPMPPRPEMTTAPGQLELDLTCIVPTNGPAVERGVLVARLQEYDPRAAGDGSREVSRVTVSGIRHRSDAETVLRFPCAGDTLARKAYYFTAVLYPEDAPEDSAGLYYIRGFQRVLAVSNSEAMTVTMEPVTTESGEPTN